MTPYIQQQFKKLCDNPNGYDDMLISWDKNPRNQREAICLTLNSINIMKPTKYPIGWEWLDKVPLEDFNWLIEIFTTMKKKDLILGQNVSPNPGSNKNDYTLYLSDPQAQYNKLLRTQNQLRNKKK